MESNTFSRGWVAGKIKPNDGFWERIVTFYKIPIFRIRFVKKNNGEHELVIRDYDSGEMIGGIHIFKDEKTALSQPALTVALNKCIQILALSIEDLSIDVR